MKDQILVKHDCANCMGRGWKGFFVCSECGCNMREVKTTPVCSHHPLHLTDKREQCTACEGSGRVETWVFAHQFIKGLEGK